MAKAKWPAVWAMTDERMGDALWTALERLPRAAGIVFRHHAVQDRAALALEVASFARERQLTLAVSRDVGLARDVGAQVVHNPQTAPGDLPFSLSVHSLIQAQEGNRRGAKLAFVSPIFSTRSHPGATNLSRATAKAIVETLNCPAIALGGVDARNYAALDGLGFSGWAGIDAWLRT